MTAFPRNLETVLALHPHEEIAVSISKDDRGDGWTLYRYDDDPRVDFSVLAGHPDIVFAHKGGFIAKTKAITINEAIEIVRKALK